MENHPCDRFAGGNLSDLRERPPYSAARCWFIAENPFVSLETHAL